MPLPNDDVFLSVERILLPKWKSYFSCLIALLTRKSLQVAYYQSEIFRKNLIAWLMLMMVFFAI